MAREKAPAIGTSTPDERREFLRRRFVCISNCDLCGICATFHGQDPEHAFADYVEGNAEFAEVAMRYRR